MIFFVFIPLLSAVTLYYHCLLTCFSYRTVLYIYIVIVIVIYIILFHITITTLLRYDRTE